MVNKSSTFSRIDALDAEIIFKILTQNTYVAQHKEEKPGKPKKYVLISQDRVLIYVTTLIQV